MLHPLNRMTSSKIPKSRYIWNFRPAFRERITFPVNPLHLDILRGFTPLLLANMNDLETILIDGSEFKIAELTTFGFSTIGQIGDDPRPSSGILLIDGKRLEVEFRVRSDNASGSNCTYSNLSITTKSLIEKYLDGKQRIGGQELEARTYDELARGMTSSESADVQSNAIPQRSSQFKSVALLVLLFLMLGLTVLAIVFMRSRSSLSINNAALVGNFLPVNARIEGEIAELNVVEGQQVLQGDLLLTLKNPEIESACIQAGAARDAAKAKVAALKRQQDSYKLKLKTASKKLKLDLEVAKSELTWAEKVEMAASARVQRLEKYAGGSITALEFEEAEEALLASQSQVTAYRNQVRQIEFSQEAAKDGILILGDRLDDEVGRITANLEIARSELKELQTICDEANSQVAQLEMLAPRDGQVYSTYRQKGQYLKIADEAIAISYPGKSWAAGHLTQSQANRVRPGQPVNVNFPSLDVQLEGVVLAVGHRAMYSKGGYNADFRGSFATDVPVKVGINDLPQEIPSGIRIEMAIKTGFGLKWLDDALGYELKPIFEDDNDGVADEQVVAGQGTALPKQLLRTSVR